MSDFDNQPRLTRAGWPEDEQHGDSSHGKMAASGKGLDQRRKRLVTRLVITVVAVVIVAISAQPIWEASVDLDTREAIGHWFDKNLLGNSYDGTLLNGK